MQMLDIGIILVMNGRHRALLVVTWGGTDDVLAICCSSTGIESKIEGEEPPSE